MPAEITLTQNPWLGLLITLLLWLAAMQVYRKRPAPYTNPVFLTILAIILFLRLTGITYEEYNVGGGYLSFLLGPAVVALAVPFYRNLQKIRKNIPALCVALLGGSTVGIIVAAGTAALLGADEKVTASIAPRSATAPIAIGISENIGGIPALTAAIVIASGILGAMVGPEVIRAVGVKSRFALGLAVGMASHGIGTARVVDEDRNYDIKIASAMSGIGMTLNSISTAVLTPLIMQMFQ